MRDRRRLVDEAGFTIIEVLVAVLLLALGIGSVLAGMAMPQKHTLTAQRTAQAGAIAERTLEAIVQRAPSAWATIAPTTALAHVSDADTTNPTDPRYFVNGSNFLVERNYHDSTQG